MFIVRQDQVRLIYLVYNIAMRYLHEDCQVIDGTYDGTKLSSTTQAVLSDNKIEKRKGYSVPLEIMPSGQFEPLYKTTLSVQVDVQFNLI